MMRSARLLLALTSSLLAFASVIGPATPVAAASVHATVVSQVRPVTADGHLAPGYTITHNFGHAQCNFGSEATGDAYRCFAGNFVIDPCWVTHRPHYVECLTLPWGHKVARLHVTRGYDNGGYNTGTSSRPWGVQTGNGHRCYFLQGATGTVGHHRINYACQHTKSVLVGRVDKSNAVWRIRRARSTGGGHYTVTGWANLARAWFGEPTLKG